MRFLGRLMAISALTGIVALAGILALVPVVKVAMASTRAGPVTQPLQLRPLAQPSRVLDSRGNLLGLLQNDDYRVPVKLSQVPPIVRDAVMDVEDDTFYSHGAVDLRSIARALVADLSSGHIVQGGSTLTQQLIKQSVLTSQRTVNRKLREAVDAFRLENQMSKNQILDLYLNTVYFGNGAYGVEAAAHVYFNSDVSQLGAAQAALLAGLIRNPAGNDPIAHPRAAMDRRNVALDQMAFNGTITQAQADQLSHTALPTVLYRPGLPTQSNFVQEAEAQLLADPRLGKTVADRQALLDTGGLTITTTIDPDLQQKAVVAEATQLPNTHGRFTSALVAIDPTTGYVRALISGNDTSTLGYDVATGRGGGGRQPGSSFKMFVLMAALRQGFSINDTIDGTQPCSFALPHSPLYVAHNAESGAGVMSLTTATADSVNCAYIRLGLKVGLDHVVAEAHRLGIPSSVPLTPVPSISIGSEGVTPLDMASAYATLADNGVYHQPTFVSRVVNEDGKVLISGPNPAQRVADPQNVAVATQTLEAVVARGTGTAAAIPGREVAGKTGTTDNFTDAWFVGFTPQLATAVWMGSPSGSVPMYDVGGINVYGGTYPARIWHAFMSAALGNSPALAFPAPNRSLIGPGVYLVAPYAPGSASSPTSSSQSQNPSSSTTTTVPGPAATTTTTGPAATTTTTPATTTTVPSTTTTTRPHSTTTTSAPPGG